MTTQLASEVALGKSIASLGRTAMRVKRERDALLKACIAAHERFQVLIDAEEATAGDEQVRDMLAKVIFKATGVRP